MSQPSRSLRFVEPKPRAKTISREKWEEHREELCSLYQHSMTLDELMEYMKEKHGFEPSYVATLEGKIARVWLTSLGHDN